MLQESKTQQERDGPACRICNNEMALSVIYVNEMALSV